MRRALALLGFCLVVAAVIYPVEGASHRRLNFLPTSLDVNPQTYFGPVARGSGEHVVVFDPTPYKKGLFATQCSFNIGSVESDRKLLGLASTNRRGFGLCFRGFIGVIKSVGQPVFENTSTGPCHAAPGWCLASIFPNERDSEIAVVSGVSPDWMANHDIRAQLAFGAISSNAIRPKSGTNSQGRDEDGYDKGYDLANRGAVLLSHPFDSLISRISHATLFAQVSLIAVLWAIAIGAIYASGGYLGYYGWRNTRGRWGFLSLFCGGWGLFALNVALIGALP